MHTALKQFHLDSPTVGDLRCDCGKLLARVLRTVLELKCSRCKRVVLVVNGQRFQAAGGSPCACCDGGPSTEDSAEAKV